MSSDPPDFSSGSAPILDWFDWVARASVVSVNVYHIVPLRALQSWNSRPAAYFRRMLYLHVDSTLMLQPSLHACRPFGLHLQHTARYVSFSSAVSEPDAQLLLASGRLKPSRWSVFQYIWHVLDRHWGAHYLRLAVCSEVLQR